MSESQAAYNARCDADRAAYLATMTETQLQCTVVESLILHGFTVLELGRGRRKVQCPHCHGWHFARGWQGNTPGAPDVLTRSPYWPTSVWLGIELKTATGALRTAQAALAEGKHIVVARSWEDVWEAVQRVNEWCERALT